MQLRRRLGIFVERHAFLLKLKALWRGYDFAPLDFPVDCRPRWGFGKPSHPQLLEIVRAEEPAYRGRVQGFVGAADLLAHIARAAPAAATEPHWDNTWLPGLDAIAIHQMLAARRPKQYCEIGSGNSTKFARRAISDHGLATRIISIDPQPRAEIDGICDEVIRKPLEQVQPAFFDRLEAGDFLFMDGSHRCFMNSDCTVFFLEVLPRLRPGVVVHIHDIALPDDYYPEWQNLYYSEQYLLAVYLMQARGRYRVLLPNAYISHTPAFQELLRPLYDRLGLEPVQRHGTSFWFELLGGPVSSVRA